MPITRARLKISDYNKKRKNRVRELEQKGRVVALTLTSMADVFAVLVVYLLLNSSNLHDWVAMATGINLPQAKAIWDVPERGATIQVTKKMVIGGKDIELVSVKKVLRGTFLVPAVKNYLRKQENKNGYVNIVADYKVPFLAMRKIITSCQDVGFKRVNLAIKPGS